ncbi:hypothetical protein BP00DRAFT_449069 [Aspergillus indologenus CBS 114.80]|uniref:Uncharacterized protein n=1 Tax=Aspergillus indologenus CBS 114.80 TaxID=1450541 RepID=A0A2V5HW43_9EURO|nr:hypothetical protein BP00DRAFT_449069 [Aspergillus indologenus CBS 114.80]
MWPLSQTLVALLGVATVSDRPKTCHAQELPLPLRQVYQFPSFPTYLESLYVRSIGDLLAVTGFPDASLYCLTGVTNNDLHDPPTVTLTRAFEEINTLTSIIETQPEIFTILDLRPASKKNKRPAPQAREIARIASGGLMIGMDTISPTTVLVADASNCLYPPWASAPVDINDINVPNGYLYWINAIVATPSRIQLINDGYATAGAESELVAEVRSIFLDKFTFGSVWEGEW